MKDATIGGYYSPSSYSISTSIIGVLVGAATVRLSTSLAVLLSLIENSAPSMEEIVLN